MPKATPWMQTLAPPQRFFILNEHHGQIKLTEWMVNVFVCV